MDSIRLWKFAFACGLTFVIVYMGGAGMLWTAGKVGVILFFKRIFSVYFGVSRGLYLTQGEIDRKLGVIQQYVSRLEAGQENLTLDTLKKIAQVLGKDLVIQLN